MNKYSPHPSDDALELFLLHALKGEELVRLEGHILCCEPCIFRLEDIEIELAAKKLALKAFVGMAQVSLLMGCVLSFGEFR